MTTLSLEPSKRIHALIGDIETIMDWVRWNDKKTGESTGWYIRWKSEGKLCFHHDSIPAPTFAELIRVLPRIEEKRSWPITNRRRVAEALVLEYMGALTETEGMKAVEEYLMKLL